MSEGEYWVTINGRHDAASEGDVIAVHRGREISSFRVVAAKPAGDDGSVCYDLEPAANTVPFPSLTVYIGGDDPHEGATVRQLTEASPAEYARLTGRV